MLDRQDRGPSAALTNEEIAAAIDPVIAFVRAGLQARETGTRLPGVLRVGVSGPEKLGDGVRIKSVPGLTAPAIVTVAVWTPSSRTPAAISACAERRAAFPIERLASAGTGTSFAADPWFTLTRS